MIVEANLDSRGEVSKMNTSTIIPVWHFANNFLE